MKKLLVALALAPAALLAAPAAHASDPVPAIDWDHDFEPVLVDGGMVVRSCDGDAPLVCVTTDDGIHLGRVEHLSYPTTIRTLRQLRAEARSLYDAIAADRADGCGAGYRFRRGPVVVRTVGGATGVSYSFTGFDAAGVAVERTRGYLAVRDGALHVVTAAAYDDGGCLGNEGEFSVAGLRAFEPSFRNLVAGTPLRTQR